ncbi:hypothetical protein HOF65_03020 [bacterium]|nr:hypothetical protein [bacterium]MBT3852968.1 hypothetical protein [bacterium]MBT4633251.1 hypothetical protein [bacterium]MBT6779009.1 hypothetical protein [bacterium]
MFVHSNLLAFILLIKLVNFNIFSLFNALSFWVIIFTISSSLTEGYTYGYQTILSGWLYGE